MRLLSTSTSRGWFKFRAPIHTHTTLSPRFHLPHRSFPMLNSSSSAVSASRRRLRGVVFDMDGTLTVPVIDFAAMYQSVLGDEEYVRIKALNPSGIDILHIIQSWAPEKQRRAYEVIADFERQGIDRLQIMPGQYWAGLCLPSFSPKFCSVFVSDR